MLILSLFAFTNRQSLRKKIGFLRFSVNLSSCFVKKMCLLCDNFAFSTSPTGLNRDVSEAKVFKISQFSSLLNAG